MRISIESNRSQQRLTSCITNHLKRISMESNWSQQRMTTCITNHLKRSASFRRGYSTALLRFRLGLSPSFSSRHSGLLKRNTETVVHKKAPVIPSTTSTRSATPYEEFWDVPTFRPQHKSSKPAHRWWRVRTAEPWCCLGKVIASSLDVTIVNTPVIPDTCPSTSVRPVGAAEAIVQTLFCFHRLWNFGTNQHWCDRQRFVDKLGQRLLSVSDNLRETVFIYQLIPENLNDQPVSFYLLACRGSFLIEIVTEDCGTCFSLVFFNPQVFTSEGT